VLKALSGMPAGIQSLEATGTVTAGDYEKVFAPLVEQMRQTGRRMQLLFQFGTGFQRMTPGALWADARLGLHYVRLLDGCAVISDIGRIREPIRDIGTWMPCPVQVFDNDKRDDAIAWLNSLPEGADVSAHDMAEAYVGGVSAALMSLGGLAISKLYTAKSVRVVSNEPRV
jgi:SpoIIAA-like